MHHALTPAHHCNFNTQQGILVWKFNLQQLLLDFLLKNWIKIFEWLPTGGGLKWWVIAETKFLKLTSVSLLGATMLLRIYTSQLVGNDNVPKNLVCLLSHWANKNWALLQRICNFICWKVVLHGFNVLHSVGHVKLLQCAKKQPLWWFETLPHCQYVTM